MRASPTTRAAAVGMALGALATVGMVGSALRAPEVGAQTAHRAAVVVDTGSGVVTRCVTFAEDAITGLAALERAGLDPVVRAFSGQGGGVCGLNGVGCPADSSCLTCQAPNYWAYYRADGGAGGFTYSSAGAGSTSVTDGDVEAWRWGSGAAPGYRSFDSVCPLQPPPTTTTTSAPSPPAGGGGTVGGGDGGGGPGGAGTGGGGPGANPGAPAPDDQAVGSATTVTPPTTGGGAGSPDGGGRGTTMADGAETVDGEEAAARTPLEDGDAGDGDARTWVAFAVLLGALALVGWRLRRIRGGTV